MKEDIATKSTRLTEIGEKLRDDFELKSQVNQDPLRFLSTLDIEVEDEFTDAVEGGLKSLTDDMQEREPILESNYIDKEELESLAETISGRPAAPTAPTNLTVENVPATSAPKQPEFAFAVRPWGLVLTIPNETVQMIVEGQLSVTKLGGSLMAALVSLGGTVAISCPPLGVLIGIAGLFCGFQAIWLLAETGLIIAMNSIHKKGVYLTWTWAHIAVLSYLPFPTPIK